MTSLSIGMLSHPLGGIFPKTLPEATRKSEVKCAIENQVIYTVCPNDECFTLYKPDVNIRWILLERCVGHLWEGD